jgi:hypothetical protein
MGRGKIDGRVGKLEGLLSEADGMGSRLTFDEQMVIEMLPFVIRRLYVACSLGGNPSKAEVHAAEDEQETPPLEAIEAMVELFKMWRVEHPLPMDARDMISVFMREEVLPNIGEPLTRRIAERKARAQGEWLGYDPDDYLRRRLKLEDEHKNPGEWLFDATTDAGARDFGARLGYDPEDFLSRIHAAEAARGFPGQRGELNGQG